MPVPFVALDARQLTERSTGDTSYWRGLVGGLAEVDTGLRFLLYSNAARPSWIPEDDRFSWIELPGGGRWWSLYSFPTDARKRGARAIHTQYNLSPLAGKIGVTTIHDVSFFIGPEWFGWRDRFILRSQVPGSVARAARVITVSETSRLEIERFIPAAAGKVRVTHNALGDNIRPTPPEDAERTVRRELGIEGPFLFTVGTRWPRKNMRLAIEAAGLLPESTPHKLVVCGKAGWGELAPNDRTIFTGYVSDKELTALYQCADLYLAPSLHEGFGIPLLEAWACGCPVLCSSGGALPEIAGDAAEIMQSWEARDWAARIAELLSDSSKLGSLRERGLKRLGEFSWKETALKTAEVYREVIG
ncbi:MAG: glycosyltransferase family 4 protein [Armatimonadetes bacterium]|nr:glycosyltransferase family 4 protein [Armatimonadota bacterium]